jgi:hypothetical protein
MNKTWNINIPVNKRLILKYTVRVEHSYDKILVYSIDDYGTLVLQATLTGSQTGAIYSLYPNGKMRVVFTSDYSVNCSTNPNYTGFDMSIHDNSGIVYHYDDSGNRISRTILLSYDTSLRSSDQEEEIVYEEKMDYLIGRDKFAADVRIYPNPTQGQFAVEIGKIQEGISGEIYLVDTKGQVLDKKIIDSERRIHFDISREDPGIYLVNIHLGGEISTWKIIKK